MNDDDPDAAMAMVREQIVAIVPRLRRFCTALAKSPDAGDDLAQATIERALRRIDQQDRIGNFDGWIFMIARNLFIDQYRAEKRHGVTVGLDELDTAIGEDGRDVAERRFLLARAQKAIAALPEDQRALVALVIIDGQSYKQAAAILEIPIGTVMSRLARARRSIDEFVHGNQTGLLA